MENTQTQEFRKTLRNILDSINQLDKQELDILYYYIRKKKYNNHPSVLSKTESELLQSINAGFPQEIQERYYGLRKKRFDETLTKEEYSEYLIIVDKIEKFEAERLKKMIALAEIRNITLDELSKQLDLKPLIYVA